MDDKISTVRALKMAVDIISASETLADEEKKVVKKLRQLLKYQSRETKRKKFEGCIRRRHGSFNVSKW